ncbi:transcriptional regulator, TetR family [Candidatus Koribacter versatilis Ellin345]|uniref:Transcriptional regulator, TetR family n=1 Tax=Koribacter versatilis (strain Ellin345) TaxID=204669 RepID=Q1IHR8_KORVE|nr:TetR/AcrR family transcriptional regulator [Candidatus Koribacter versatilis]ABF43582.1 transcriptional regulator, TetR family [Candidatus Koribacter versatilis Ellin345]
MRYEPEHKKRTRDRIVRNAARKLRAEGLGGPGVASVMKASGLTVGGFYKHFRGKDELLAEAVALGFAEIGETAHAVLKNVPREDWWKEVVRWYLSSEHCDHPATGCPVAALASEIGRAKVGFKERISGQVKRLTEQWAELMPGANATERERNFFAIYSAMVGALSVARLFTDPADREKVLASARDHLLRSF